MRNRIIILFASAVLLVGCSTAIPCDATSTCTRVLFIGNSYTYVNDLPTVFAQLAGAGNHAVETGMQAQGGWTLEQHANDPATLQAIRAKPWTFVVLQEQSEIPAIIQSRTMSMYPAAASLVQQIRQNGSTPLLLMTWAHRDGLLSAGLADYQDMQFQIEDGYLQLADRLDVGVAPAGFVWGQVREQNPDIGMWQDDGSHPNEKGTYLAACVLYATIFRESPEGLAHPFLISNEDASVIQSFAARIVLARPAKWHLE